MQVIEIDTPDVPTAVYVPGTVREDLAPLTARVAALEEAAGGGLGPDAAQDLIDTAVAAHAQSSEPHPAYDNLPSLSLIFENGLV